MAFFGVTKEKISSVERHPNADRLAVAKVAGMEFQFVIALGQFAVGDECLYFPVDSLLPKPLQDRLGLAGKLAGPELNRIKTISLRGVISQGVVAKPDLIEGLHLPQGVDRFAESELITSFLGVTKYDPAPIIEKDAILTRLPCGVSAYDIEGADRFADVLASMMDMPVCVTEKLEGENFSVTVDSDGQVYVNKRECSLRPKDGVEHPWWRIARECGAIDFALSLKAEVAPLAKRHVVVYGEMCGVGLSVKNYYQLPNTVPFIFDIRLFDGFMPFARFKATLETLGKDLRTAAVLGFDVTLREWLGGRTVQEAADGPSAIAPNRAREGIVIKPMEERRDMTTGRLILKCRGPRYLSKES